VSPTTNVLIRTRRRAADAEIVQWLKVLLLVLGVAGLLFALLLLVLYLTEEPGFHPGVPLGVITVFF
jgi:hypothetical protein